MIKKREDIGIKHFNDRNAFIECSNMMNDIYQNIDNYNPNRQRKMLIVFDNMIVNIKTNKKVVLMFTINCLLYAEKYFTCVYHTVLFFCSKRCEIKFNALFDHED